MQMGSGRKQKQDWRDGGAWRIKKREAVDELAR
jgi:hypothetical protein